MFRKSNIRMFLIVGLVTLMALFVAACAPQVPAGSSDAGADAAADAGGESGEAAAADEGGESAAAEGGESGEAAAADAGQATIYTVQPGDTLSQIAENAGLSLSTVMTVNNILNANQIKVGDQIVIPASEAAAAAGGVTQTYTVQIGDSLGLIAQSFGVTMQAIQDANGITNANRIEIGQTLIIPAP